MIALIAISYSQPADIVIQKLIKNQRRLILKSSKFFQKAKKKNIEN
jgi:hypothetical protein